MVPDDLVGTTHSELNLASTEFVDLVRKSGITGLRFAPCPLTVGNDESLDYYLLCVSARGGAPDFTGSEEIYVSLPGGPSKHFRGIAFDTTTLNGSDFFMLDTSGFIIASSDAAEKVAKAHISGVEFIPTSEFLIGALELSFRR
jgi:hypothetical protein